MSENLNHNRGEIRMSKAFLLRSSHEVLSIIFSEFFPLKVTQDELSQDTLVYLGLSRHFETITPGQAYPIYGVTITAETLIPDTIEHFVKFTKL
jgi:hypothetical protein